MHPMHKYFSVFNAFFITFTFCNVIVIEDIHVQLYPLILIHHLVVLFETSNFLLFRRLIIHSGPGDRSGKRSMLQIPVINASQAGWREWRITRVTRGASAPFQSGSGTL